MYLMGTTRPISKLHKEQNNSCYATCSTHPEPNLDGTVKHRTIIAGSIFRESEEMYNVAFCNCVPSSNIIVNLLGHLLFIFDIQGTVHRDVFL